LDRLTLVRFGYDVTSIYEEKVIRIHMKSFAYGLHALTPEVDRAIVYVVIAIANDGWSEDELRELARLSDLPQLWHPQSGEPTFRVDGVQRRKLQSWFRQIVAKGNVALDVRKEIAKRVRQAVVVTSAWLEFADGSLRPQIEAKLLGVEGLIAYGVALLVSRGADEIARRLGQCKKCGRFFFDELKRAGRPRKFCSPAHKNAMMQWQHRNREKRWVIPEPAARPLGASKSSKALRRSR